ncbi:hypothetical protein POM88_047005 [Heracleum sosnowskyi]|uniref:Uncharacterized protein n=1 Tax=Heracleum sosnowskyi TaxID=360622 RepID=A0AAD8H9P0_9APIA|nr:hypothetical protein POM88_047005 [Heracleum sosnowskyi]
MAEQRDEFREMEESFVRFFIEEEEEGGLSYMEDSTELSEIDTSDKFCEKLFDAQGGEIAKPYGTWMRADPKRRSHTMGSKWLRSGGANLANKVGGGEVSAKSDAVIIATECRNDGNKIGTTTKSQRILATASENQ